MAFPVFLQRRPPRHRPALEVGTRCAVHGAAPGILWTASSPCLFLWSDHQISRSPLLLLPVSPKCSVVVAIVVVQFLLMCPALLVRRVHFGFSSDELCVTPRVFVYLLNLCKFYIWQSRKDFRFRNVPPRRCGRHHQSEGSPEVSPSDFFQAFPIFPSWPLLPPLVGRLWCRRFRNWQCSVDCSLACFSAAPCFILFFVRVPPLG